MREIFARRSPPVVVCTIGPRAALRPHRALRKATPQPIERAAAQQQELVANSAIMPHAHTALALCDADRLDVVLMHASGS